MSFMRTLTHQLCGMLDIITVKSASERQHTNACYYQLHCMRDDSISQSSQTCSHCQHTGGVLSTLHRHTFSFGSIDYPQNHQVIGILSHRAQDQNSPYWCPRSGWPVLSKGEILTLIKDYIYIGNIQSRRETHYVFKIKVFDDCECLYSKSNLPGVKH